MFKLNGIPVVIERYPDETPRLNIAAETESVTITWLYERDEEMQLLFITRHLRERWAVKHLVLHMPYIPHARMDRVKKQQEVFTLKYFCEFINSLCFDQVIVRDAHSAVSLALLNHVTAEPIEAYLKSLAARLLDPGRDILFFPDEGSCKRYAELLRFPCAFGLKKRDWGTGQILGLEVQGELPAAPFNALIIDDISSFGGTFLHAARRLKALGAEKVYLYVTHCEDSILQGELISSGLLERIFTTQSIFSGHHPLIEILGGEDHD